MKRVLHIVRSPEVAASPAAVVAEHDVLVYTYVPAQPPARAWLLWPDPAHTGAATPEPLHVQVIDTNALCRLAFELDIVVVW